jgi:hypothetical protein
MWQWDNENGEFTEQAMRMQYWLCLIVGILALIVGAIAR